MPEIFALALLLGAYRPLLRRAGGPVSLWFYGWCCLMAHFVVRFFCEKSWTGKALPHLLSLLALEACGLIFLLAVSHGRTHAVQRSFVAGLTLPMAAQAVLYSLTAIRHVAPVVSAGRAAGLLFLLPLMICAIRQSSRNRFQLVVGGSFALFGVGSLTFAATHPREVTLGALALLFFSDAYLCLAANRHAARGALVTGMGLGVWGVTFPLASVLEHLYPGFRIDFRLLELPQYLVMAGSIVTLLEEHLLRTERMATHDPLTDLPNRRRFEERFAEALEEAHEQKTTVACLVIDVDDFKHINDTMGHTAGDQLLTALAVRLSWHISSRDILARTGGDEFTAMLAGVTDEHHLRFIASAMMSAASVPVVVEGKPIDVCISVGIALSPDDADDMDGLLKAADEAMYRAKRRGGNKLVFAGESFARELPEEAKVTSDRGTRSSTRSASGQILRMGSPSTRVH